MLEIDRHHEPSCPAQEQEGKRETRRRGYKKIITEKKPRRRSMSNSRRRLCVERKFPVVAEGESVTPPRDGQGDDRKKDVEKGNAINWRDWGGRS